MIINKAENIAQSRTLGKANTFYKKIEPIA
jgi:hypothetical protein